eukprot:3718414-Rhodomonas_salina.2
MPIASFTSPSAMPLFKQLRHGAVATNGRLPLSWKQLNTGVKVPALAQSRPRKLGLAMAADTAEEMVSVNFNSRTLALVPLLCAL